MASQLWGLCPEIPPDLTHAGGRGCKQGEAGDLCSEGPGSLVASTVGDPRDPETLSRNRQPLPDLKLLGGTRALPQFLSSPISELTSLRYLSPPCPEAAVTKATCSLWATNAAIGSLSSLTRP